MDKDPMIELTEFHNNLYGPISDSRENLIEVSLKVLYLFWFLSKHKIIKKPTYKIIIVNLWYYVRPWKENLFKSNVEIQ